MYFTYRHYNPYFAWMYWGKSREPVISIAIFIFIIYWSAYWTPSDLVEFIRLCCETFSTKSVNSPANTGMFISKRSYEYMFRAQLIIVTGISSIIKRLKYGKMQQNTHLSFWLTPWFPTVSPLFRW